MDKVQKHNSFNGRAIANIGRGVEIICSDVF
jgi:hypothetical protein